MVALKLYSQVRNLIFGNNFNTKPDSSQIDLNLEDSITKENKYFEPDITYQMLREAQKSTTYSQRKVTAFFPKNVFQMESFILENSRDIWIRKGTHQRRHICENSQILKEKYEKILNGNKDYIDDHDLGDSIIMMPKIIVSDIGIMKYNPYYRNFELLFDKTKAKNYYEELDKSRQNFL